MTTSLSTEVPEMADVINLQDERKNKQERTEKTKAQDEVTDGSVELEKQAQLNKDRAEKLRRERAEHNRNLVRTIGKSRKR